MRKYSKILLTLLLVLIALIPTIYIIVISIQENNKYNIPEDYVFNEKGFGLPKLIEKKDFQSYMILKGEIDIHEREVYKLQGDGNVLVENQTEIYKGMPIAVINGEIVYADFNGILDQVQHGSNLVFIIKPFGKYVFKTTQSVEYALNDKTLKVIDDNDQIYQLEWIYTSALQRDNLKDYYYRIENPSLYYGQKIRFYKEDKLLKNVYYVSKESIYYDNEFQCYMMQVLDEEQNVKGKVEVKILGEDFNDYAIQYDDSIGNYVDYSYGSYRNEQNKLGDTYE